MDACLEWKLLCLYRQMENTSEVLEVARKLGAGKITCKVQKYLLDEVIGNEVCKKYPPDVAYTARVLKLVILAAEKDAFTGTTADSDKEQEPVLEEVYVEHVKYMEAVSKLEHNDTLDAKWCYRTYAYATPAATSRRPERAPVSENPNEGLEEKTSTKLDRLMGNQETDLQPIDNSAQGKVDASLPSESDLHRDRASGADSEVDAKPASSQLVTVRVSLNLFEGGTGCTTWSAGFYLAEFALSHPEIFAGMRCLELGAGAGVLGVVLARLRGVRELILTDGNEETMENLRGNLALNGVSNPDGGRGQSAEEGPTLGEGAGVGGNGHLDGCAGPVVRCELLDWEHVSEAQLHALGADVILGADVLYDPGVIPDLVRILLITLGAPNDSRKESETAAQNSELSIVSAGGERYVIVAYIATALRNESTLDSFVSAVKTAGLRVELVDPRERTDCFQYCRWMKRERIRLHRITWL